MNGFDENRALTFEKELDMPDVYKLSFNHMNLKEVTRIWARDCTENR